MKNISKRRRATFGAVLPVAAALAAAPVVLAAPAQAATTDISVTYSTQNAAPAPTDGSYTVHGRVGQTRNDMKVVYTIQSTAVRYPTPVITYTGDFTDTADATYTFRFDCDATVSGADCVRYAPIVQQMNTAASALDGRSIAGFTADVTPIIQQYGGTVPAGIRGTVTVSVNSDVPGNGKLEFFLQEGSAADAPHLSPTVTTPLSITQPKLSTTAPGAYCRADLAPYTRDGYRYTPTKFGQASLALNTTVVDNGILPDDVTAVGVDQTAVRYDVGSTQNLTAAQAKAALLAVGPGVSNTVVAKYTAPDGVAAANTATDVRPLADTDQRCWSREAVVTPPKPTPTKTSAELAETGAGDAGGPLMFALATGALGIAAVGFSALRRRALTTKG